MTVCKRQNYGNSENTVINRNQREAQTEYRFLGHENYLIFHYIGVSLIIHFSKLKSEPHFKIQTLSDGDVLIQFINCNKCTTVGSGIGHISEIPANRRQQWNNLGKNNSGKISVRPYAKNKLQVPVLNCHIKYTKGRVQEDYSLILAQGKPYLKNKAKKRWEWPKR